MIGWLIFGIGKVADFNGISQVPKTKFSIIVPFRNESDNLPKLLESFSNLDFPTDFFEVILVDDASDKKFIEDDFRFKVTITDNVRSSYSPKKDAIVTGITLAENEWIITTDADCCVTEQWLKSLDNYIQQKKPQMIAGAVRYSGNDSFLHYFQQIELASLQGITMGSFGNGYPFMCNGANFAYTKSFFQELDGFIGNKSLASGDDVFLLQKAVAFAPEKVCYLKSDFNTVTTNLENSWKTLFYQRVRWASKSGSYYGYFGPLLGLIVVMGNSAWIVLFIAMLTGGCTIGNFLIAIILKNGVDLVLAFKNTSFVNQRRFLLAASFLYPFFSVFVAVYSLFGKYKWKGRTFGK